MVDALAEMRMCVSVRVSVSECEREHACDRGGGGVHRLLTALRPVAAAWTGRRRSRSQSPRQNGEALPNTCKWNRVGTHEN